MTKSKNKQKEKRLKQHLHLNIPAELYEKIKETGLNVSRFVEEALNALISGRSFENIQNTLILRLKSEKEWTRGDSNSGPPPCQGDVIARPDSENKPNPDDSEISTPLRKKGDVVNKPTRADGSEETLMSLADLQAKYFEGYKDECLNGDSKISPGTFRDYKNAVETYGQYIFGPADIRDYYKKNEVPLPEKVSKGAAKLFEYLYVLPDDERRLNGYLFGDYIKAFNKAKSAEGSKKEKIAYNVSSAELKKWVAEVPKRHGDFFLLLAYTGARIEQLFEVLTKVKPKDREKRAITIYPGDDDKVPVVSPVFCLDVRDFSSPKKLVRRYYVPFEVRDLLLNYVPAYESVDTYSKAIKPEILNAERAAKGDDKTISAKTLRKWNTNQFLAAGVPGEIAGWIEGRKPTKHNSASAVTWNNYGDLDDFAAVAYSKLQDHILSVLPRDTKFGTKAQPAPKEEVTPEKEPKSPRKPNAAAELLKKKGVTKV